MIYTHKNKILNIKYKYIKPISADICFSGTAVILGFIHRHFFIITYIQKMFYTHTNTHTYILYIHTYINVISSLYFSLYNFIHIILPLCYSAQTDSNVVLPVAFNLCAALWCLNVPAGT